MMRSPAPSPPPSEYARWESEGRKRVVTYLKYISAFASVLFGGRSRAEGNGRAGLIFHAYLRALKINVPAGVNLLRAILQTYYILRIIYK